MEVHLSVIYGMCITISLLQAEMTRKIDAIDQALRDSVQRIAMGLEQQCDERKGSLHQQRLQHRAELDTMYNSLLQDFLTNAQVTVALWCFLT